MAIPLGQRRRLPAPEEARNGDRADHAQRSARTRRRSNQATHLTVGLTASRHRRIIWIHNAKYYQFWNDGSEDGKFLSPKFVPATIHSTPLPMASWATLCRPISPSRPAKRFDLGKLDWTPVRYGRQLWDIGYPDRTGDKFFKGDGDNYWLWGWNLRYALLFPNDITYTIGTSDYRKDWFFEQVPHATNFSFINPDAKDPANQRFGWVKGESLDQYPQTNTHGPWAVYGEGRPTVWTIKFNLEKSPQGTAFFRVALAGVNQLRQLAVAVNGHSIGGIGDGRDPENPRLISTNTIHYNSDKGLSQERTLKFDALLLKRGENSMTLTVPGGDLQNGVVWDYLRLELNESTNP